MPRSYRLAFREAIRPDVNPVTRFGGQPAWLEEPVTPLSRRTGKPMTFICQIEIPADWHTKGPARMAYVFMTGGGFDYDAVETWNPDEGETAVIVQKALAAPPAAEPYPDTLKCWEEVDGRRTEVPHEYAVDQTPVEEPAYLSMDALDELDDAQRDAICEAWSGNKIGGCPTWVQYEEFPYQDWHLLLQLEDGTYPFNLNLGTGVGYVFLDAACTEGKLLWQC